LTSDIVTTPYSVQIVKGAQDAALARGQTLLIIDTGGSEPAGDDTVEHFLEWRVDGLIFATEYHRPFRLPAAAAHVPTVLVNCFADREAGEVPKLPTILPDEVHGGRVATEALIQAGHRRTRRLPSSAATTGWPYHQMGGRAVEVLLDPQLVAAAATELITCPLVQRASI
jgi:LacI family transcriptional regulator